MSATGLWPLKRTRHNNSTKPGEPRADADLHPFFLAARPIEPTIAKSVPPESSQRGLFSATGRDQVFCIRARGHKTYCKHKPCHASRTSHHSWARWKSDGPEISAPLDVRHIGGWGAQEAEEKPIDEVSRERIENQPGKEATDAASAWSKEAIEALSEPKVSETLAQREMSQVFPKDERDPRWLQRVRRREKDVVWPHEYVH